jgi:hypothetical protein
LATYAHVSPNYAAVIESYVGMSYYAYYNYYGYCY